MTTEKRLLKVFLCHASADKTKVRELYRTLKRRGVQPWLDAEDLIPGQNWEVEIPKALLSSDAIIICLTPNSVDKEGYVQKEIKFALDKAMEMPEGRIFIIPARLEECDLPFSLSKYQAVNLYEKTGYTKLMQALKLRASQLERATVELPKAGETTAEIEKIVEEKTPPELKEEKPETKIPKPSPEKIGVGGNVSDSVIVMGNGNVINMGAQSTFLQEKETIDKRTSVDNTIAEIKTHIEFGLYAEAYKKCIFFLSKVENSAFINLLAGIAYTLEKEETKLRDNDIQIINKHISLATHDSKVRATALAVLGCIKHSYYYLNKIYDPSNLTLDLIKEELRKNPTSIDRELLNLIVPTEYALEFLNIK